MSALLGLTGSLCVTPYTKRHTMATRVLSRRAMREQHDQAEQTSVQTDATTEQPAPEEKLKKTRTRKSVERKPAGVKPPAKPRARKKTIKEPGRRVARWALFDNGNKRVAAFEYNDREGADAKLAAMQERKNGTFFLQLVKDPYDPPAAELPVPVAPARRTRAADTTGTKE